MATFSSDLAPVEISLPRNDYYYYFYLLLLLLLLLLLENSDCKNFFFFFFFLLCYPLTFVMYKIKIALRYCINFLIPLIMKGQLNVEMNTGEVK